MNDLSLSYTGKLVWEGKDVHSFDIHASKGDVDELQSWIDQHEYTKFCMFWRPWSNELNILQSLLVVDDEVASHIRLAWENAAAI